MGVLDRWFPMTLANIEGPVLPQIEQWVDRSHLEEFVVADVLGTVPRVMNRAAAMKVPAVARARHLTAGTIAGLPFQAMRGAAEVTPQPYWMQGTDGQLGDTPADRARLLGLTPQSPWQRLLWTVDDLLFTGASLWDVTRVDVNYYPTRMLRVPVSRWSLDEHGVAVDIDHRPIGGRLVYIPGPHDGILSFAANTIATAAGLEYTAAEVSRRPFRLELHQVTGHKLTDLEIAKYISTVRRALADNDGILWTNEAIETKDHPLDSNGLLLGARNLAALDVARHVSMPAAMIDATTEGASLEYATLSGRNQQWLDYGLSLYMNAITARLGMDDVVPSGQRVALLTDELTAVETDPAGAPTDD